MNFALLGFIFYLVVILVVGFVTYNNNKSHKDFFIAGRKLNPWVMAFLAGWLVSRFTRTHSRT